MGGPVTWDVFYLLAGVIITVGSGVGVVLWNVRGMFATLEATLAERIDRSRHVIRDEMTGHMLRIEQQMSDHRGDDSELFRLMGERLARVEERKS